MFCGECGTKNEKGAKFCEKCGAKLEVAEEKKESPKAQQQPVKTSKPMTKQNKIIIAAVSAVVVLLIAFVFISIGYCNLFSYAHISSFLLPMAKMFLPIRMGD